MNKVHVTLHGFLGTDPTLRTAGEVKVANFRMGSTPGWFDRNTGTWANGETQWYTVNCWRALGENVRTSLRKGDPVVVSGRLNHSSYVNRDGVLVNAVEIDADFVGPDLNRCRTRQLIERREDEQAPDSELAGVGAQRSANAELDRLVDSLDIDDVDVEPEKDPFDTEVAA